MSTIHKRRKRLKKNTNKKRRRECVTKALRRKFAKASRRRSLNASKTSHVSKTSHRRNLRRGRGGVIVDGDDFSSCKNGDIKVIKADGTTVSVSYFQTVDGKEARVGDLCKNIEQKLGVDADDIELYSKRNAEQDNSGSPLSKNQVVDWTDDILYAIIDNPITIDDFKNEPQKYFLSKLDYRDEDVIFNIEYKSNNDATLTGDEIPYFFKNHNTANKNMLYCLFDVKITLARKGAFENDVFEKCLEHYAVAVKHATKCTNYKKMSEMLSKMSDQQKLNPFIIKGYSTRDAGEKWEMRDIWWIPECMRLRFNNSPLIKDQENPLNWISRVKMEFYNLENDSNPSHMKWVQHFFNWFAARMREQVRDKMASRIQSLASWRRWS